LIASLKGSLSRTEENIGWASSEKVLFKVCKEDTQEDVEEVLMDILKTLEGELKGLEGYCIE